MLDNPNLIAACVVGDGEAETGPLATSWHSNKFLNPKTDGAVIPILNLNGYKISNPTVFARISDEERIDFFKGCGYEPYVVEGNNPLEMHELMASTLDKVIEKIKTIWNQARTLDNTDRPIWPMIILKTPKGWTGPKEVNTLKIEGSFRAHQVPIVISDDIEHNLPLLESWMKSYKPEELFDENGALIPDLKEMAPTGNKRMGANPHANGGILLEELRLPDFRNYGVNVISPGEQIAQDMKELGVFIRDIIVKNEDNRNFRIFGPDEALSNRLSPIFEKNKQTVLCRNRRFR